METCQNEDECLTPIWCRGKDKCQKQVESDKANGPLDAAAGSGCCACDEYPATWTRRVIMSNKEIKALRYCWMCRDDLRDMLAKGLGAEVWNESQWTEDASQNASNQTPPPMA